LERERRGKRPSFELDPRESLEAQLINTLLYSIYERAETNTSKVEETFGKVLSVLYSAVDIECLGPHERKLLLSYLAMDVILSRIEAYDSEKGDGEELRPRFSGRTLAMIAKAVACTQKPKFSEPSTGEELLSAERF